ncbi:MAG: hypothetical protein Q8L68_07620, partial [Methylococcales bacterium]|nr:hypothetical protein [Methylococcales bacterium]
MRFMIFTQPDDAHAVMVQLALIESGHQVRLFFTADQPSLLSHSIWMDASQTGWRSSDIKTLLKLNAYDVIWYRRVHLPLIKKEDSHPDDYQFVARENRLFFEGLTTWLSHQAWWVNPALAARQANSKLLQLFLARSCGLKIPKTLCSNTPQDIH